MKKLILCATIALSLSAFAAGKVSWLETSHSFGTFNEEAGNAKCTMSFVNTGDSAVIITNVRPSCGCTASEYPHDPIMPGDTARIAISFNPTGRPGHFSKEVYVYTSVEPRRTVLQISGNVIGSESTIQAKFPVSVGALKIDAKTIPFGEIKKGKSRTAFINGYNQGSDSLRISFANIPADLRVAAVPAVIAPGELTVITATYYTAEKNDWGLSSDHFDVVARSDNAVGENRLNVEVLAIIYEDFGSLSEKDLENAPVIQCSTYKIDCGTIMSSDKITKEFKISNQGKSKLQIRKIASLDKYISASSSAKELKPGKSATVKVVIDPALAGDYLNAHLSIISNDPQSANSSVRVVGLKKMN